ncbi:manganese/zinc/iron transport system permease protein [Lishizhenia tianjinensis]|uniref:Manganese/zinc/iron transport system permease protein n=1 Tax=Lishizhenia tianjinensis TaxID=477690 RepID=A0A1I6YP76_9FLAO|nr:manganese/zinc/iron transport system permease protein [Lishizhenia tianjinensis]
MNNLLVMLTAVLIGTSCSLLGSFLILRKSVMIGDAISHSVLPGIVLAFIFTEERAALPILIGAAVFGVLTTMFIQFLQRKSNVQEGAAIGISFTFFFALGVIMIALSTGGNVDIDQDCVLFGEIASTYLDKIFVNGYFVGTRSILTIAPVLLIVILFVVFGMKGLRLTSFNEDYAKALGINVNAWNYALLMLVSITAVLSFEAVGAVLVVGFLTIPPASAYLITNNLSKMLWLSVVFTLLSAVGGTLLALTLDVTISGMIVSVAGILFLLTWSGKIIMTKSKKIEKLSEV